MYLLFRETVCRVLRVDREVFTPLGWRRLTDLRIGDQIREPGHAARWITIKGFT